MLVLVRSLKSYISDDELLYQAVIKNEEYKTISKEAFLLVLNKC